MTPRLVPSSRANPRACRRAGFSFVEVLFAVMILGIGFIMIAGVFPVAISQTALSQEETIGAQIARGAANAMSQVPYRQALTQRSPLLASFPSDDVARLDDDDFDIQNNEPWKTMYPTSEGNPQMLRKWSLIRGVQILPEDPRFAWIPLLMRTKYGVDGEEPRYARLITIPVQSRIRSAFTADDQTMHKDTTGAGDTEAKLYGTLMPLSVRVRVTEGKDNPDVLLFDTTASTDGVTANAAAAAPGAVVVIRNGNDKAGRPANGRTYRLGNPTANANEYDLLPGNDMLIDPGDDGKFGTLDDKEETSSATGWLDAYLVGQGLTDPTKDERKFSGGSMVVGVYSAYVKIR